MSRNPTTRVRPPLERCGCKEDCLASISPSDNTTIVNGKVVLVDHLHRVADR